MQGTKPALDTFPSQAPTSETTTALVPTDRAVTGPARSPLSLSEIEDFLAAMVASAEGVSDEQMTEYLADLGEASEVARQKRDRCAHTIFRYDEMVGLIEARRAQLQERMDQLKLMANRVKAEQGRFERYLVSIVEQFGEVPKRAKNKRLEGNVFALALATSPDSVSIENESEVPAEYKRVTVTLDLPVYERLVELGFTQGYTERELPQGTVAISKTAIKQAFAANQDVPGADLKFGDVRLEVKARKA